MSTGHYKTEYDSRIVSPGEKLTAFSRISRAPGALIRPKRKPAFAIFSLVMIFISLIAMPRVAVSKSATDKLIFQRQQLNEFYWSEGANFADINRDGVLDAISGPFWWAGPGFTRQHEFYPATEMFEVTNRQGEVLAYPGFPGALDKKAGFTYSNDYFFSFAHDFSGDGWQDIVTFGAPGTPAYLYINPQGKEVYWARYKILNDVGNESPTLVDLTGDGFPEIVCVRGGQFGYAVFDPKKPKALWQFHALTKDDDWNKYTHGLGVGDINGDGRNDLVFNRGWFEQPEFPSQNTVWKKHDFIFSAAGGAQMHIYDVNGDGLNDVVSSMAAHAYGLAWYEQVTRDNHISFKTHVIMSDKGSENAYGVNFSQLHALELVDINGDGLKDIVTGKTFWAHGLKRDPGRNDPPVVYWFQLMRDKDEVRWLPHLLDNDSGIGRQIGVADVNGDGHPDIINSNKKGTFVFQSNPH